MKQIIRYATQVPNVGKSKRETKTSDTAMTETVATMPRTGCLIPNNLHLPGLGLF
jgi:hypothetical protein